MANRPQIRPFDYATAYSRLGGALADIPSKAIGGYMKGKELEFAESREQRAQSKEKRDTRKAELNEDMVLAELEDIQDKKDRRKAIQDLALQTIVQSNPDIPAKELAQLETTIKKLNFEDVGTFMSEYAADQNNNAAFSQKWGGQVKTTKTPVTSYLSKGSAANAEKRRQAGAQTFLQEGLRSRAQEYIQMEKKNPSEEGFTQFLTKDQMGTEIATNPEYQKFIKTAFLGELDRYKARTGRIQAHTSAKRADPGVEAVNNQMLLRVQKSMQKNTDNANKLSNFDKSLLNNPGQFIQSEKFNKLSEDNQKKAIKVAEERIKLQRIQEMTKIATQNGIKLSEVRAEGILDDILDADGATSPESKVFAEGLGILPSDEKPTEAPASPSEPPSFKTAQEAMAAGLPKGTIVIIEGIGEVEID